MASVSTAGKTLYFFDGTVWIPVGGGGAPTGASVIYSASQPDITDLEVGTIWVDSNASATGGGGGGGGGTGGPSFQTIVTNPSTESIVAATAGETLSIISGENISITNASANNSITFNSNINTQNIINTASAAAYASASVYTDQQISTIDLSSTIQTASAAAFASASAYTDQQISTIDLSSTIQTASAAAVSYLVDGAPESLDTLNELSAALNDNANILDTLLTTTAASSIYLPISASAAFTRWTKTLSASATVISGVDDNSITLQYNPSYEQVFINGVLIAKNEYTATSGSAIVLAEAAVVNDVIDIYAYQNSTNVNTYSQAQIDAKYNNLTRWKKVYTIPGNESFTVTNDGSGAYVVAEVQNPTFNLVKGNTYTFVINASGHPFWIQTVSGGYSSGNVYSTGTTNLGTDSGTITWVIPANAPDTLYYACQYHSSMQGTINLIDPAKVQGNDDNSLPLSYTSGYEQVYLNGILLTPITDYARTSASVITLGSGVVTNDVIEIINTQPFNVADVYTTSQANSTFLTPSSASSTYLTQVSASTTYATKADFPADAWASYTPTWTNLTVGNGTNNFAYKHIGKTVFVRGQFIFGSTSSISGTVNVSLPVTAKSFTVKHALGTAYLEDSGVAGYAGGVFWLSTTTIDIRAFNASGTYTVINPLTSTVPFTWGTNDHISFNFTYEAE